MAWYIEREKRRKKREGLRSAVGGTADRPEREKKRDREKEVAVGSPAKLAELVTPN